MNIKRLSLIVALLMATMLSASAEIFTYTYQGSTLKYESTGDNTCTITGLSSVVPNLVIPETAQYNNKTYSVTAIGNNAFQYRSNIQSVNIPNTVITIGRGAFEDCSKLESVNIPNSVTSIGGVAFNNCTALKSAIIGNGVTTIGSWAFSNCTSLNDLVLGSSLTSIGERAFNGCTSLKDVIIPPMVSSIGTKAFYGCPISRAAYPETMANPFSYDDAFAYPKGSVTENRIVYGPGKSSLLYALTTFKGELVIPNTVTSIGSGALAGCTGLTSVTFSNSLTTIGGKAFDGCSSLTSIIIPDSVTTLGGMAFGNCTKLKSVIIGNSVTKIGSWVFYNCTELTHLILGNSVMVIAEYAFSGCSNLDGYIIPRSVIQLDKNAFYSCQNGKVAMPAADYSITNEDNSGKVCVYYPDNAIIDNGVIYNADKSAILYVQPGMSGEFTVPGTVTKISDYAFARCKDLTSVSMPNSVTSIGNSAFSMKGISYAWTLTWGSGSYIDSSALTSISIPNSVTEIGEAAFYHCNNLPSIIIPDSVTKIGRETFYDCQKLKYVNLPNSLTSIGKYAFYSCGVEVIYSAITEPFAISNVFGSYHAKLRVPVGTIDKYRAVADWNKFSNIEESESNATVEYTYKGSTLRYNVLSANECSLFGYASLAEVVEIPSQVEFQGKDYTVTSIDDWALLGCTGFKSVVIPNSVTKIGYEAFRDCSGLTSVTIPNSVTEIDKAAFSGCSSLTSVTIPNSVTEIGAAIFSGCSSLTSVTIPNSVTTIGYEAFRDCSGLTSVSIPNSVTEIDLATFSGCSSLISVTIPNSVTTIGNDAFYGCSGLTSVSIPNSVTTIGNDAFYYCSGLTTVTINSSSIFIGGRAFQSCPALTDVYCYPTEVPKDDAGSLGYNYPFNKFDGVTLHVRPQSKAAYAADRMWRLFNIVDDLPSEGYLGIDNVSDDVLDIENAVIYNMHGVRVTNPGPGLYIVNGKKMILN